MSIVTVKDKYQVVIPQDLREQVDVNIGDFLEAKVEHGKITFTPKSVVDRDVAESIAEFKAGKGFGPYAKHKDFIASLHRQAKKYKTKK